MAHCEGVSGIEWLPTRIAVSAKSLSFKAVLVSHVNWLPSFENSRIFLLNNGLPMISLHPLISSTSPQLFFTFVKSFTLTLFFFYLYGLNYIIQSYFEKLNVRKAGRNMDS